MDLSNVSFEELAEWYEKDQDTIAKLRAEVDYQTDRANRLKVSFDDMASSCEKLILEKDEKWKELNEKAQECQFLSKALILSTTVWSLAWFFS